MNEFVYLKDSYQKQLTTTVVSCEKKGDHWQITLKATIFYPEGGGQPSDRGTIKGKNAVARVRQVRLKGEHIIHEATVDGAFSPGDQVECEIDWKLRYFHMRVHSAGHIVHEAVKLLYPQLVPTRGEHGKDPYIEYEGSLPIDKKFGIEKEANVIVEKAVSLTTEFVTLEELQKRAAWTPAHLPKNKPLRILSVGGLPPIPDGGTQVAASSEVGPITIGKIENTESHVRVHYTIAEAPSDVIQAETATLTAAELTGMLLDTQNETLQAVRESTAPPDQIRLDALGAKSPFAKISRRIVDVPAGERQSVGIVINQVKNSIEAALTAKAQIHSTTKAQKQIDVTMPGTQPPIGHLHLVSQAIMEITRIFERIGFTRVRHPEVDWDWYPFESLNMPPNHPARDEWETFFIQYPGRPSRDPKKQKIVLTPHTSNGQVREMEKGKLPIRMINIAKCYRRQIDISHVPMFHQFEGLYVDRNVSISHLKGVFDHFAMQFFGPGRKTRLRPFHFQFTEPSFEVDITCGICAGTGILSDGAKCRLCKSGWLELGGAGMVHPVVLRNGGIDPDEFSGFAFGWGIERTSMMKSGTQLDDIRLLYGNDVRFLQQF